MAIKAILVASALVAPFSAAQSAQDCLTDWGTAGEIVRREKLMTVEDLSKSVVADGVGQIVKTTLCKEADGYVYRLVVRDRQGQLKSAVISAKSR